MKRLVEKYIIRVSFFAVITSCAVFTGCGKPETGEMLLLVPFLCVTTFVIAYLAEITQRIIIVYGLSFALVSLVLWRVASVESSVSGFMYYLLIMQSFIVYAGFLHILLVKIVARLTKRNFLLNDSIIVTVAVTVSFVALVMLNADDNGDIGDLTMELFSGVLGAA
ncbi:MAG TPA: hypothetical protein PKK43_02000, partial [Spirochaetota bacterium]|nr:hypothetical protein [Spirochaetota bacterium]